MERRDFVRSALVTASAGLALGTTQADALADPPQQEFYLLRKYSLRNGPQLALMQDYFEHALIPGLNRLGIPAVGVFKLDIGPETPTYYLLVPSTSSETLVTLNGRLAKDAEFTKAATAFQEAPATAPPFVRLESTLLSAFTGWPKLVVPKQEKRIFQLRTYESPSHATHFRKVQMFNEAEIGIFTRHGLTPVFFADTIFGARIPCLTYMLTFADTAELTAHWAAFSADPAWHELSHKPGNTDAEIVSNISNLYLSPLPFSQI